MSEEDLKDVAGDAAEQDISEYENLENLSCITIYEAYMFFGIARISAKLGKAPVKQAMLRNLTVGLLTMLVTFLVGHIFHVNV